MIYCVSNTHHAILQHLKAHSTSVSSLCILQKVRITIKNELAVINNLHLTSGDIRYHLITVWGQSAVGYLKRKFARC